MSARPDAHLATHIHAGPPAYSFEPRNSGVRFWNFLIICCGACLAAADTAQLLPIMSNDLGLLDDFDPLGSPAPSHAAHKSKSKRGSGGSKGQLALPAPADHGSHKREKAAGDKKKKHKSKGKHRKHKRRHDSDDSDSDR